jgi:hypothetical protein
MLARFALPAATIAVLGATVSTASAALTAPQTLSPVGQSASFPFASMNADGDAAVQWDAFTDGLQVSMRPAGGSWEATPTQLTAPGANVAGRQVVIDSTGAATAIWGEYTTTIFGGFPTTGPVTIFTARRPAGAAWGAPEQLSTPSVNAGFLSVLAVGPDDRLVAVWDEGGSILSATRTSTGGWGASAALASASTNQAPRVAIDASGTATAAWQDASTDHVMSSTLAPGGAWTTPVDVSGVPGYVPTMAMNEDGDATLVWNGGSTSQISSRRATTAGAWSAPTQISVNGGLSYYTPSVAVDGDGRATAAWSQANLVGGNVRYDQMVASRAADGTWGTPVSLGAGSSDALVVSAAAGGEVTVAWRGLDAQSQFVAQTATRAPGGTWPSATDLTDLGNGYPDVSVDRDADALFVAASSRVVAQADDRAGPRLRNLSVPATATVGVASSFAVSPIDAWSPLGTTTWDFGDGTTATGATPSHTYATAGTKTVTVTATDALGHTSTTTASVLVSPALADPSPPSAAPDPAPAAGCASRRVITLHPSLPAGNKLRTASLEITGQETRRLNRWASEVTIDLRGVRLRSVTVRIKARTTAGKLVTDTRVYKTCGRPA